MHKRERDPQTSQDPEPVKKGRLDPAGLTRTQPAAQDGPKSGSSVATGSMSSSSSKPAQVTTSQPVKGPHGSARPTSGPTSGPTRGPTLQKKPAANAPVKTVDLIPATIDHPPAPYPMRLQHLRIIRDKLEDFGTPQHECNELAIELERKECLKSSPGTYKGNIRLLIRRISRGEYKPGVAEAQRQERARSTAQQLNLELAGMVIPASKLPRYVMEVPEPGFEFEDRFECDRCKQRVAFDQLVPDLEAGIERCRFHLMRRTWNPETKKLDETFPCCGATLQEPGCQWRPCHVYKLAEPRALHARVPFVETPPVPGAAFALGIDCEMAYTTKGMELIRVTAVSWETGGVVFDRIVRPSGRILDLNTRFSGVSDIDKGIEVNGTYYEPLSFDETRSQLFTLVGASTILIGHGLENDLIAMRIVHNAIVDTAVLFPRVKTRTHSLKQLAWMYLSRIIQTGEHDSMEDSLAAMDIIKKDIMDRIKTD